MTTDLLRTPHPPVLAEATADNPAKQRDHVVHAARLLPVVSVVIPTLNAQRHLPRQLAALSEQDLPPFEIIVIDSDSTDATRQIATDAGCRVVHIPRSEFDHGGTRNRGAWLAEGNVIVFMTQDALPVDSTYLRHLVEPIVSGAASASYARQVAYPDATPPERLARAHNYPSTSHLTTVDDIETRGLKAFFFSNVASAVERRSFEQVNGFPDHTVMNEDMLLSAKLLHTGRTVAYAADAAVFHSHNYGLGQQFKRNFDIGAFVAQKGEQLGDTRAGASGLRFALAQIRSLAAQGDVRWIPRTMADLVVRFIAFRIGRRESLIPVGIKRRLSMHAFFW